MNIEKYLISENKQKIQAFKGKNVKSITSQHSKEFLDIIEHIKEEGLEKKVIDIVNKIAKEKSDKPIKRIKSLDQVKKMDSMPKPTDLVSDKTMKVAFAIFVALTVAGVGWMLSKSNAVIFAVMVVLATSMYFNFRELDQRKPIEI